MKNNYQILEKNLKINFKDKNLLIKSLIHKSYDKENNNEKIEFLGDRVLGLIIAKKLLEMYPNEKEGILDKKFASLVNKKTCLEIANKIELQKFIIIDDKNKKKKIEDKVIADSCESLIGAIYLDQGFNYTEKIILNLWKTHIKKSIITQIDAKTKLQELSLKKFKKLPVYKLISNTGPRHLPVFKVGVKLIDTKFFYAEGKSKKDAEQNAAINCLNNIKNNSIETVSFGTEAGIFNKLGFQTVVCGPGSIKQAHKPDEFIELIQLKKCENFLKKIIKSLY